MVLARVRFSTIRGLGPRDGELTDADIVEVDDEAPQSGTRYAIVSVPPRRSMVAPPSRRITLRLANEG
jgi:hypothetical protein